MIPVPVGVAELDSIISDIWATYVSEGSVVLAQPALPLAARAADLSAQVSVTGEVTATVVLCCSGAAAADLARRMFALPDGAEPSAEDIQDTLGELANVVGGNIKALAPMPGGLTLPVVTELSGSVVWPEAEPQCSVDVAWEGGQAALLVWTPASFAQIVRPMLKGSSTR